MKLSTSFHLSLIAVAFWAANAAFAQGSLTPPGAPAPTMKKLEQIEPRIDLQNAPASAVDTSNANYHFIINQPGSYYLSANLGVTKTNGIQINAEGVTLDLNGFEISRSSGSGGSGIEIPATAHRASVRNGSVKDFADGIASILAIGYARTCAFRDISASACTSYGIHAGQGAVLESCRAYNNSGNAGIRAEVGSSLTNCTAYGNSADAGIYAASGSVLHNCTASSNTGTYGIFVFSIASLSNCNAYLNSATYGIYAGFGSSLHNCSGSFNTGSYGIYASTGSSLTDCTTYNNTSTAATSAGIGCGAGATVRGCSSYSNRSTAAISTPSTGMGFTLGAGSTIQECAAYSNEGDGISFTNDCLVRANQCNNNGLNGDGAGLHATSSDNRIEANNVSNNDRGIDVSAAGNIIMKNTASGNTSNYEIVADNRYGQVIDITALGIAAVSGNSSAANAINSTNPWANFSF